MRGGSRGGSRGVDRRSPRKRADYVLPEGGPAFNATKQMAQVFHSRDRADPYASKGACNAAHSLMYLTHSIV